MAAVAAAAAIFLSVPVSVIGQHLSVQPPPAVPTSADQIQNIDQVKTAIKGYYGDTVTTTVDPVPNDGVVGADGGDKVLHTFSATGSYANEMAGVVADAEKYLRKPNAGSGTGIKAILFDVDDTTLNTYNYEIYSNFVYNPTQNGYFVNACLTTGCVFPAVPHMVDLAQYAQSQGYTVLFLTGRPGTQKDGTIANLEDAGYDVESRQPVPEGLRRRYMAQLVRSHLHDDPVQVPDPPAHRIPRLRHRRQLRRPVQRPDWWVRRRDLQAPEPDVLPALTRTRGRERPRVARSLVFVSSVGRRA